MHVSVQQLYDLSV